MMRNLLSQAVDRFMASKTPEWLKKTVVIGGIIILPPLVIAAIVFIVIIPLATFSALICGHHHRDCGAATMGALMLIGIVGCVAYRAWLKRS
jgi:hypothetical protein